MKWNTKNKSAWALLIPDASDYDFLPLSNFLGKSAIENLFNLNLQWQSEIFNFIREQSVDLTIDSRHGSQSSIKPFFRKSNHDFFIYTKRNINSGKINVKEYFKKNIPDFSINLQTKIPKQKDAKQHFSVPGLNYNVKSTAGKMKCIVEQLSGRYSKVTVWNLESPALMPFHFIPIIAKTGTNSAEFYTIKSFQDRLVLLSYNSGNVNENQNRDIVETKIPALYDLQSIPDIICNLSTRKSKISLRRALDLSAVINSIRLSLP